MENKTLNIKKIVSEVLKEHISQKEMINEDLGNIIKKLETSYGDDIARTFKSLVGKKGNYKINLGTKEGYIISKSGTQFPISKIEQAIDAGVPINDIMNLIPDDLKDGTEIKNILKSVKPAPKPTGPKPSNIGNVSPATISNIAEDIVSLNITTIEQAVSYLADKIKKLKLGKIKKGYEKEFIQQMTAQLSSKTKLKGGIQKVDQLVKELELLPLSEQKEAIKKVMEELKKAYPNIYLNFVKKYGKKLLTPPNFGAAYKAAAIMSMSSLVLDIFRTNYFDDQDFTHMGMGKTGTFITKVTAFAFPYVNFYLSVVLLAESVIRTSYRAYKDDKPKESTKDKLIKKGKSYIKKGEEGGKQLLDKGKNVLNNFKNTTTTTTPTDTTVFKL